MAVVVNSKRQPDIVLQDTPRGRITVYLEDNETLCPECGGKGRLESCAHCGNRGYMIQDA